MKVFSRDAVLPYHLRHRWYRPLWKFFNFLSFKLALPMTGSFNDFENIYFKVKVKVIPIKKRTKSILRLMLKQYECEDSTECFIEDLWISISSLLFFMRLYFSIFVLFIINSIFFIIGDSDFMFFLKAFRIYVLLGIPSLFVMNQDYKKIIRTYERDHVQLGL